MLSNKISLSACCLRLCNANAPANFEVQWSFDLHCAGTLAVLPTPMVQPHLRANISCLAASRALTASSRFRASACWTASLRFRATSLSLNWLLSCLPLQSPVSLQPAWFILEFNIKAFSSLLACINLHVEASWDLQASDVRRAICSHITGVHNRLLSSDANHLQCKDHLHPPPILQGDKSE